MPGVVDLTGAILHVTDTFAPETGGVERVVECLAREQVRRGRRVIVLTKAVPDAPAHETREDGIVVYRYPHALRFAPWVYLSSYLGARRVARKIMADEKPALVHYHLTLSAQGPLGALPDKLPSVYSFYGPWHAEFAVEVETAAVETGALYRAYLRAQMATQRWLQRRLLNAVRRVVVLSEFSRTWIARLAPHRAFGTVQIPGGIDVDRFAPGEREPAFRQSFGIPEDAFVVLTLRRLVHRMGIDLLIEAVASLQVDRPVHLLIAGQGPLRAELSRRAAALGIDDRVHFVGFVADDRLPALYRTADLFVVPTRAEENFGLIVLEAAACGVPVAATPAGSLPEVLAAADDTYLATDVSAAALAKVITAAIADGDQARRRFTQVVSPRVRQVFAWRAVADRMDALYAEIGVQ